MALAELTGLLSSGVIADATDTDVAILSVASMVGGYVLLAALWYFVFREKARDKRKR